MRAALGVAVVGFVAMVAGLWYGFGSGNGWTEVRELMGYPWFVVSLVDVYTGFALFACWIAMREKVVAAGVWIIALLVLGNIVACVYAILAIRQAQTGQRELMGRAVRS